MHTRLVDPSMKLDTDLIDKCIEELDKLGNNPDELLLSLQYDRLSACNQDYIDKLNKNIDSIIESANNMNVYELARAIKKICRYTNSLYTYEMSLLDIMSKEGD